MSAKKLMELRNIKKSFAGVHALTGVDFDLNAGEIHSLCGENGAGKSTLMKILAGNYPPTSGEIIINGESVKMKDPLTAEKHGVAIVYQELSLSHTITIAENMFMGREPMNKLGLIKYKELNAMTQKYLDIVKCPVEPDSLTGLLTIAEMQMVQIAKALSVNAKILVLDEPCSSISEEDSERLFDILKDLRKEGIGIIYIDHRLDNIFKISDRVTVFRDGQKIATKNITDTDRDDLVGLMVGRSIDNIYPKTSSPQSEVRLSVKNLKNKDLKGIDFEVRRGEVFGLAGLVGAGRSEIVRAIFGVDKSESDREIAIDGEKVNIRMPKDAISAGIGYIPEDRKFGGLCLYRPISFNTVMVYLKYVAKGVFAKDKALDKTTTEILKKLDTKYSSVDDAVSQLSGGNQQKVVICRWLLMNNMKVLLMDEPTRGIDVGAKHAIYELINELASQGMSIILITSELPELIGICDRIAVVNQGKINGLLERSEFSQEAVMKLCV